MSAGTNAPLPTIGMAIGSNWNGNHHHHPYYNRYYAYPFSYGGYYAYSGYYGSCGWLYRRAVATNNPYWWNRYYACAG